MHWYIIGGNKHYYGNMADAIANYSMTKAYMKNEDFKTDTVIAYWSITIDLWL